MYKVASKRALAKGVFKKMISGLKKGKKKFYDQPFDSMGPQVTKGYRRAAQDSGADSFLLSVPGMVMPKKMSKKWQEGVTKHVSIPATKLDTALGEMAGKVTGAKNLFKIKEKVPIAPSYAGKAMKKVKQQRLPTKRIDLKPPKKKDGKLFKEVNRSSVLAPATKTMGVVVPMAGAYTIDEQLGKLMNKDKNNQNSNTKVASPKNLVKLDKTAAVKLATEMIRLKGVTTKLAQANQNHEKRAKAEKLVYKQASMGLMTFPQSYEDLLEKVASLENQDLDVLEKALELQVGDVSLGQLQNGGTPIPTTPEGQFLASVIDEDSIF